MTSPTAAATPDPSSPYDGALASAALAPEEGAAPEPVLDPIDLDEVREADEADTAEDDGPVAAGPAPAADPDPDGSRAARQVYDLVDRLLDLGQQARLSPEPTNGALEEARRALTSGSAPTPFGGRHPVHLLGELVDLLDTQVEGSLAAGPADTLGESYLTGIGQAALFGLARGAAGVAAATQDPTGAGIDQARALVGEIGRRMDAGDSLLSAVNGVLNPLSRAGAAWAAAEELAGRALDAAQAGDWPEAHRQARAAGRQAAGFSGAVVDTATLAAGGAKSFGRRVRPRLPDPPPKAPRPPTSTAVAPPPDVRRDGSAAISPRPEPVLRQAVVHPRWTSVPVVAADRLQSLLASTRALYAGQLQAARQRLLGLTRRGRNRERAAALKPVYNTQERLHALERQQQHPDRAYLYDVRAVGVETPGGLVRTKNIPGVRAADPKSPGRVFDVYELGADGSHRPYELKTATTTVESVPRSGGVEVAFLRGSKLGKQLAKTDALRDFASKAGGRIRLRGTALDGTAVDLLVDPATMRSTVVSDYGAFRH